MTAKSGVLQTDWRFICFHCVMAFRRHVITSGFVIEGYFFSLLFRHPCLFLRSLSRQRKRALVTLAPPISLETDEAASPPSPSPPLRPLSLSLFFFSPVMSQMLRNFPGSPPPPRGLVEGGGRIKRSLCVSGRTNMHVRVRWRAQ